MDKENLKRELYKILDVVTQVGLHLDAKDRMNAALHMSETIRATPLAVAVHGATDDLGSLIEELNREM